MNVESNVTIVMATHEDHDFARASIWSVRRYHPRIRIIVADSSEDPRKMDDVGCDELIWADLSYGGIKCHYMDNMAAGIVETELVLFMSPDVKVIGEEAIPLLARAMDISPSVAETGAYGIKVIGERKALVGTQFTGHMELDACAGHFQMHRTEAFKIAGMYHQAFFWAGVPDKFDPHVECDSDQEITRRYNAMGLICVSPAHEVPILHWVMGSRHADKRPYTDWYQANVSVTRCNPLNNWNKQ
jgi:hypothetical protein